MEQVKPGFLQGALSNQKCLSALDRHHAKPIETATYINRNNESSIQEGCGRPVQLLQPRLQGFRRLIMSHVVGMSIDHMYRQIKRILTFEHIQLIQNFDIAFRQRFTNASVNFCPWVGL